MVFTMATRQPSDVVEVTTAEQRRVAKRMRVLKSAKLILDDMRAIDCAVRDISATGAKVLIGSSNNLPDKFKLFMVSDSTIRDVEIAWKRHDMIGVNFTNEAKSAALRKF
jgi:2-succinyl-5-enolpyruvyl-6-hydroxy-3-cyclohexene-1-carboxylate synthase